MIRALWIFFVDEGLRGRVGERGDVPAVGQT